MSQFDEIKEELLTTEFDSKIAISLLEKLEARSLSPPCLSTIQDGFCFEWTDDERVAKSNQVYVTFWEDFTLVVSPSRGSALIPSNDIDRIYQHLVQLL